MKNRQMKRRVSFMSFVSSAATCVVLRVDAHALAQQLQRRLLEMAPTLRARQQLEQRASVLAARLDIVAAADEMEKTARRGRQQREEESGRNAADAPRGKQCALALQESTSGSGFQSPLQCRRVRSETGTQKRRQSGESRLRMEQNKHSYASYLLLERATLLQKTLYRRLESSHVAALQQTEMQRGKTIRRHERA